tara:strand:- start:409 stop:522 length:114 start_codon:yes stop_codon:yes gene_type:complete
MEVANRPWIISSPRQQAIQPNDNKDSKKKLIQTTPPG